MQIIEGTNSWKRTEFIKVIISREWEGRKAGATYATTKTYIIIDEEVCFTPMYVFAFPNYMKNLLGKLFNTTNIL